VEQPLTVGCYSGSRHAERPQWVEREGRRVAVAGIDSERREEERLVFDVTLEDGGRLTLYYYSREDVWLGVERQ
jgi:hypothetical protein